MLVLSNIMADGQAIIKSAINLFEKGQYETCIEALEAVLSTNERDTKTNYYLGASYVMSNRKVQEGIRRLKFAQAKGYVGDSHYYLGRAYQLQYEFELATTSFDKFLKGTRSPEMTANAQKWRTECQNSITLASKIFNIRVIDKYKVSEDSLLLVYNPSKEVGTIARNKSFFESDVDPEGVLYRTERGDAVYFTAKDEEEHSRIYKMEKLLDGWSEMTALGLGEMKNEKMAVMMTDGTTLYFSSDRDGGMGGYDIYRTTYDIETRSFSEPVNLGVPFNSAFDDFLFVGDEFRTKAWFASTRETHGDSIMVYEILWDESVIRSFAQNTDEIRNVAALKIDPSLKKMRDNVAAAGTKKKTFTVKKEEKQFEFVINDSLKYTQWEHFRSEEAREMYRDAVAMKQKKDSLSAKMTELRKEFRNITSDEQRSEVINEVMKIERVAYNLEDQLDGRYDKVRKAENAYIAKLAEDGEYVPLSEMATKASEPKFDWDKILVADNFAAYSEVPFNEERRKNAALYKAVFSKDEREELMEADSLYAWAGILALEAENMGEGEQANYIAMASAVLYGKAMDQKFDIFDDKYMEIADKDSDIDYTEMNVLRKSAVRDFGMVENVRISNGLATMQKADVMKRRGLASYTEAMTRYMSHLDGSFPLPAKQKASEPMSVVTSFASVDEETAKRGDSVFTISATEEKQIEEIVEEEKLEVKPAEVTTIVEKKAEKAVEKVEQKVEEVRSEIAKAEEKTEAKEEKAAPQGNDATASPYGAGKPVYRIQLGVFRNKPDAGKLSVFDTVSSIAIPEKGLTKYYGGAYPTYVAAQAALGKASGFGGAFIVAFLNGKQVKLSEAQKAE